MRNSAVVVFAAAVFLAFGVLFHLGVRTEVGATLGALPALPDRCTTVVATVAALPVSDRQVRTLVERLMPAKDPLKRLGYRRFLGSSLPVDRRAALVVSQGTYILPDGGWARGADRAARIWFGRPCRALNWGEAALLSHFAGGGPVPGLQALLATRDSLLVVLHEQGLFGRDVLAAELGKPVSMAADRRPVL